MYESKRSARGIQLKAQYIIISQLPLSTVSRSPSYYITAQCQGSKPVEGELRGSLPTMQLTNSGLSPADAYYPSLLLLLPSTHQPTLSLPFPHTHTQAHSITNAKGLQQQQQHREMEISAACVSACSRWVQGQERMSVSDAWMRCIREKRGREWSERKKRDISEDLMRFWDDVCLLFFLSYPDNLNLCRMYHNYSSCHCTGCLSLNTPAACESCSSGWTVPWHPLNTWMNTGSTGDLCFLVHCTSDLFLKVRVGLLSIYFWSCTQALH